MALTFLILAATFAWRALAQPAAVTAPMLAGETITGEARAAAEKLLTVG